MPLKWRGQTINYSVLAKMTQAELDELPSQIISFWLDYGEGYILRLQRWYRNDPAYDGLIADTLAMMTFLHDQWEPRGQP